MILYKSMFGLIEYLSQRLLEQRLFINRIQLAKYSHKLFIGHFFQYSRILSRHSLNILNKMSSLNLLVVAQASQPSFQVYLQNSGAETWLHLVDNGQEFFIVAKLPCQVGRFVRDSSSRWQCS